MWIIITCNTVTSMVALILVKGISKTQLNQKVLSAYDRKVCWYKTVSERSNENCNFVFSLLYPR